MDPGIYDIPADQYHAGPGISKSMLDLIAKSPAYLKNGYREATPAMELGTAAHCAILEPDHFQSLYCMAPDCRRGTKEWKAAEDAAEGRIMLKPDDWGLVHKMQEAVYQHPAARELLQSGKSEQSLYWIDEDTSLLCRARPDYLRDDRVIVDLKTTSDASPEGFSESCARYRYHCQNAFYSDGCANLLGNAEAFIFIAVESTPPFGVAVYELTQMAVSRGRELYHGNLRLYVECESTNTWTRYSPYVEPLELPAHAY